MSWREGWTSGNLKQDGMGPGFTRFTRAEFKRLRVQHNVMVLVGNGFDIQALHDYSQPVDSRYASFYYYLKMRSFNPENRIFRHMEEALEQNHPNWSDVEAAVSITLKKDKSQAEKLLSDLQEIQAAFAQFLQMVAPSRLLDKMGADARDFRWSLESLSEFLRDFSNKNSFRLLTFPRKIDHYNAFNFLFVNFNYTTILDNYIYLDQKQFDPLMHQTVDTNFRFKTDPRGFLDSSCFKNPENDRDNGYSGYVTSQVLHPHGILSTPRSLLFGTDAEDDYKEKRTSTDHFKKPYWSQAHTLYRNHFDQADLFIIFGCSLGETDGWWWRNILRALRTTRCQTPLGNTSAVSSWTGSIDYEFPELIIYRRQDGDRHTVASVKNKFIEAADGLSMCFEDRQRVLSRIHVILYDDQTPRTFLNTRRTR